MPYFFKLSDKTTVGRGFESLSSFLWLRKVLFVAGDVANHCRGDVSVYIIESIDGDDHVVGDEIRPHDKYEYFTPKGIPKDRTHFIGTISKKTITNLEMILENILSTCLQYHTSGKNYNLLKHEKCIHNEIKQTLKSLDDSNPIKRLYKSYDDNDGITHMMHMTCSDRDSSISENGLFGEDEIINGSLQLLNGPDLEDIIPSEFLDAWEGNGVKKYRRINKRHSRTTRCNRTKQKITKKRLYKKKKYI